MIKQLSHLDPDLVGVYDLPGWYLQEYEDLKVKGEEPVFQCQFGHSGSLREHSIGTDGSVSPEVICHCGRWQHGVTLSKWPAGYYKNAGQVIIQKLA